MGGMNLAAFTAPFQYARPVQQETPWDAAAKFGQLRALAQMAQLRQAEVQNQQLQAQRLQQDLQNEAAVRQLFQGTEEPTSQQIFAAGGPKYGAEVNKGILDMHKSRANMQKAQLDHAQKEAEFIGQTLGDAKDDATYQPALAQLRAAGIDTSRMPANYDKPTVDGYITKGQTIIQQIEQRRAAALAAPQLAEAQAKAQNEQMPQLAREVQLAQNQEDWNGVIQHAKDLGLKVNIPAMFSPAAQELTTKVLGVKISEQPKYQIETEQAAALANLRAHPESLNVRVGSVIDPKEPEFMPALNAAHNVLSAGGSLKEINDEIDKYAATVRQRKSAVLEANAKIPGEVARTVAIEKAKAEASPEMFSDILEPSARMRAETTYQKAGDEAITKINAAQDVRHTIYAATHGNKAAPAIIPIETLRSYVNRVNRQELEQVQGGGSLLDRLIGKINGLTEGQPIPPDILQGLDQLAQLQEQAARRIYSQKVNNLATTYSSKKIKAQEFPAYEPPGGTGGAPKKKIWNPQLNRFE